jgi:NTE family protein
LFAPLSVAEAAMLCTLMERIEVPAGHTIVAEGGPGDALYLVEAGEARLEVADHGVAPVVVGRIGAGECYGHLAMLADAEHCASVVAATDMTLLRLSKQAHATYLAGLPDIDGRISRHALRQWAELERHRRLHAAPAASGVGCACGDTCACAGHDHHGHEPEDGHHDHLR